MSSSETCEPERIRYLTSTHSPSKGDYVLYWMQQSQRVLDNHALEYSALRANELNVPLVVLFILTPAFPEANLRHYHFMLQGLRSVASDLPLRGIRFLLRSGSPPVPAVDLSTRACLIVTDMGYLRIQRQWRRRLAEEAGCPVVQVESDVIVPVETASEKEQYSAATLRPRIHRHLGSFLRPVPKVEVKHPALHGPSPIEPDESDLALRDLTDSEITDLLSRLGVDASIPPVSWISGGTGHALQILDQFIETRLGHFHDRRNDPGTDLLSNMSPFLHFGQISPVTIALRIIQGSRGQLVTDTTPPPPLSSLPDGTQAYLEELIVRRELSMNFSYFNDRYDSLDSLHDWAKKTLSEHASDPRPVSYSRDQLERAETEDPYWNAAQKEMICRGKMHGYMRMYWGKKILEWSPTVEEAHAAMVYLNNKYFLDGRDANGYTGIAWCFGKHDRGWKERAIFGKIRYMNARGLERKFNIDDYVRRIDREWKSY